MIPLTGGGSGETGVLGHDAVEVGSISCSGVPMLCRDLCHFIVEYDCRDMGLITAHVEKPAIGAKEVWEVI